MTEFFYGLALGAGLFIAMSAVVILSFYWCHYPHGHRKQKAR